MTSITTLLTIYNSLMEKLFNAYNYHQLQVGIVTVDVINYCLIQDIPKTSK